MYLFQQEDGIEELLSNSQALGMAGFQEGVTSDIQYREKDSGSFSFMWSNKQSKCSGDILDSGEMLMF